MRIAFLSVFYPYRGGISQTNAPLFEELSKEHEVKAFNFKRQYPELLFPGKTQYVSDNDDTIEIDSIRLLDSVNPFSYYKTLQEIRNFKPDILITRFWLPFFAPSLGYICSKLRKDGVFTISILDNIIPHENRLGDKALTSYFLKRNDAFIVLSSAVEKDLLSFIPNAKYSKNIFPLFSHFGQRITKSEARKILDLPQDKKILLFFGFIRDYKGLDLLIEALAELDESYHLLICGEVYGSFDKYDELIKKLNLEEKITKMIRFIDDKEIPEIFSASDVCVLPYRSATQTGIVAIAYSVGVPLIATNVGGLKEIISPYETGTIAEEVSSKSIKKAIEKFYKKDLSFYSNNIEKYKKVASWKSISDSIVKLFNK